MTHGPVIRVATPADVAEIEGVFRRASLSNEGDHAALLANPDALEFDAAAVAEGRTLVAVEDDRVVGFATTRRTGDVLELDDLFVEPDRMRRGIATALVRGVEEEARTAGVRRVGVTANEHALAFYTAAGFVADGTAETRFGPAPRMALDVPPDPPHDGPHDRAG